MKTRLLLIGIVLVNILSFESIYSQAPGNVKINLEWNQWRGPNRDGISFEKNIDKNWPVDGPEVLWRTPVGDGYSGIAVSGEKLFTMWDEGDSQYLICMAAEDGNELWRFRVDNNYESEWGDGPLATPIVDQTTVYAISTHGFFHAVNIETGHVIWSQNLVEKYGLELPDYGYSVSPLIENEKLFIENGGQENFAFIALNKRTGELLWHSQTDEAAYSSPIAITINGKRQIVFMSAKGLFSLSPEEGSLLWNYDWESRCSATDMVLNSISPFFIAPDKLFVSSGFGTISGGALIQIKEENGEFMATELWLSEDMNNAINSSVFYDNFIYGFDNKKLTCLDALTGTVKWTKLGFQAGSLILVGRYLIILGENGQLALVEATPDKYTEVAQAHILSGRCWTPPTLANGKLYLRNQSELVCLKINTR